MRSDDSSCPFCGADVSPNARGCRSCGAAKDGTGEWFHAEDSDGIDLGDEFDYEDFVGREFGKGGGVRRAGKDLFWWFVAVITLVAFALLAIRW